MDTLGYIEKETYIHMRSNVFQYIWDRFDDFQPVGGSMHFIQSK